MKLYNPFKKIEYLEMQVNVLEHILDEKYRDIEGYLSILGKIEDTLSKGGIRMEISLPELKTARIPEGKGKIARYVSKRNTGNIRIVIDTSEHDREVLKNFKK